MDNILLLHSNLKDKTYKHGGYKAFNISDPKPRNIHKASVRDRLLHHAVYRVLYPYFDKKFIHDSYSSRLNKGTHKALIQFNRYFRKVSKNNTRTCWVLKCDIKKFFASIDHQILRLIVVKHIADKDIDWLISEIVGSFSTPPTQQRIYAMAEMRKRDLPLGNLTSQLLVNIYMNEFDQFVKHGLKQRYYIRYADDFIILSASREDLEHLRHGVNGFLRENLKLSLHSDKIHIKTASSGVDFLGWVHFPDHRVLRTTTKRRMFKNLENNPSEETVASYLGMLKYGNTRKLRQIVEKFDRIS